MTQIRPEYGVAVELEDGVRRILAPNPSAMTFWGTNTYLVGRGDVAIIDPGPENDSHFQAILDATDQGKTVSHIFVTHAHVDHSEGATALAQSLGVPVIAYGPAEKGISPIMANLISKGMETGGEGVDRGFIPDFVLDDGETISGQDWSLTALWTPGHLSNHICLSFDDVVFSGDHVMDWATSIVSPPDGDLGAFMSSCEKLLLRGDRIFYPGHGNPVADPEARINWLLAHRKSREAQILAALSSGECTPVELTKQIYTDVAPALLGAAERNVFAHLIDLYERGLVSARPKIASDAVYALR
jgi:glyoxylase-like metal-dependent hydrolase (beta-lactamase superfamily II)